MTGVFHIVDGEAKRMTKAEQASFLAAATPSADQLFAQMRAERDRRLAASDWVTLRSLEAGTAVPQPWLDYRQALRDLPEHTSDPAIPDWPQQPE